jgi:peptidoglycan hydrolase-like protein with peptidoglycan-binding domain
MTRHTTLHLAGMLVLASASTLAAQASPPPTRNPPTHQMMGDTTPRSPTNPWTADQIREVQHCLMAVKLYDGKATGVMNTDTKEALKKFQRTHGMAATGVLSDSVLVLLDNAKKDAMHAKGPGMQ